MKKQLILLLTIALFFTACNNNSANRVNRDCTPLPSLINIMTFEDQDVPDGKAYTYTVTYRFFLQDKDGKNIYTSKDTKIENFNSDKNAFSIDFSKITKDITASATNEESIRYELDIERESAGQPKEKISLPETPGSQLTTFEIDTYLKALEGSLDCDNRNNLTTQKIKFYFVNKKGGPLPGGIQPPIKPVGQPQ